MKLHVLKNRPLRPLADRARTMAECADEVWIATAFVSQLAVDDIVGSAVHAGAQVRFLTGTFGKVTRSRTFEAMFRLSDAGTIRVRVWHGDYHAKLFLFRKGRVPRRGWVPRICRTEDYKTRASSWWSSRGDGTTSSLGSFAEHLTRTGNDRAS